MFDKLQLDNRILERNCKMSDRIIKYQCPACGAPLVYSAQEHVLKCNSCDSEYPEDGIAPKQSQVQNQINWNVAGYVENQNTIKDNQGFICSSCGAEVVSDEHTVATECMYCGNPVVMSENISDMVSPDLIIPFSITKEKAQGLLRNFYKGKKLLPDAFTNGNRIEKITGVYVPFWLFDCTGVADIKYNATLVKRWSDANFNYTNTKYFEIFRSGSLGFNKVPVDASSKLEDNYMDGLEPYNFKKLEKFSSKYLAGYFADKFDVGVNESIERANQRVESSIESEFRKTVKGYTSVSQKNSFVQVHGESINYTLLPVWMLNTKYEDKIYQFAINGQTGQIAGELPIDKKKLFKYRVMITCISTVLITLIASQLL